MPFKFTLSVCSFAGEQIAKPGDGRGALSLMVEVDSLVSSALSGMHQKLPGTPAFSGAVYVKYSTGLC